ncbi:MAG TPA: site-2 protease family protein [Chthoniobacterales bacterium]|nr:site-2 protease family protein [Chthoniobacterales bacterium]
MKWSYRIARVAGIDVRVHATFLLLIGYWGLMGYQDGGSRGAIDQVIFGSFLFLCVVLHEFGHAFAARGYGIRTPDITLLPIGGVARLERMPENPRQELVIALAGPMVNVAIAAALWIVVGTPPTGPRIFDSGLQELGFNLLYANLFLVVFNLIPAFPMDGGRVLRALLSFWLPHPTATKIAARIGQGLAIVFAIVGLFGIPGYWSANPFLLFIAMFIFTGAQQEAAFADMRAAVAGMHIADAMITRFHTLAADLPLAQAVEEAQRDMQSVYPVTDSHLRPVGIVPRNELLQATAAPHSTVGSIAHHVPSVRADALFGEAFVLMQESGSPVLPVVNPAGQVVGIVSLNLLRERAQARR